MSYKDVAKGALSANTANLLSDGSGASAFSDSKDLASEVQAFIVHDDGAIKIRTPDNQDVVLPVLAKGVVVPIRVKRFFSTGTAAALKASDKVTLIYLPY
jgi:hypothetical protein